jgi:hypothetical protein
VRRAFLHGLFPGALLHFAFGTGYGAGVPEGSVRNGKQEFRMSAGPADASAPLGDKDIENVQCTQCVWRMLAPPRSLNHVVRRYVLLSAESLVHKFHGLPRNHIEIPRTWFDAAEGKKEEEVSRLENKVALPHAID